MLKNKQLRIFLAVIILLFFLHYSKLSAPLEFQFFNGITGSQQWLYQQSNKFGQFIYYLFHWQELLKENQKLNEKIIQLTSTETKINILTSENENLKKTLNYLTTTNYRYQTANIIGRNLLNPNLFILDKGSDDGLKENLAVILNEGIMLGKIDKVQEKISYFLLLTDSQSIIAAKTLNADKTSGLIKGQLGINAIFSMIPQNEVINNEDVVVTSGLEENIPKNLLIGKVIEIEKSPAALFKEAVNVCLSMLTSLKIF